MPAYFNFGDLAEHFLGRQERQWPDTGRAWLLGCQFGEAGCWPLTARISLDASTVNWLDFTHEHRQERTYAGLGPYVFERTHYEAAVAAMVRTLRQRATVGHSEQRCPGPSLKSGPGHPSGVAAD